MGLDPLTLRLTRWAMGSWKRLEFLNRYLGGTLVPGLELDFLPGLFCAAHWVLIAERPPATIDDFVVAGRAVQRFWLTAARLGLFIQPEVTPLVFHEYVRDGVPFTGQPGLRERAARISQRLERQLGRDLLNRAMFMGRIGHGRAPRARSTRLPLERLMRADSESRDPGHEIVRDAQQPSAARSAPLHP